MRAKLASEDSVTANGPPAVACAMPLATVHLIARATDLVSWKLLSRLVAAEIIHDNDVTGTQPFR